MEISPDENLNFDQISEPQIKSESHQSQIERNPYENYQISQQPPGHHPEKEYRFSFGDEPMSDTEFQNIVPDNSPDSTLPVPKNGIQAQDDLSDKQEQQSDLELEFEEADQEPIPIQNDQNSAGDAAGEDADVRRYIKLEVSTNIHNENTTLGPDSE